MEITVHFNKNGKIFHLSFSHQNLILIQFYILKKLLILLNFEQGDKLKFDFITGTLHKSEGLLQNDSLIQWGCLTPKNMTFCKINSKVLNLV